MATLIVLRPRVSGVQSSGRWRAGHQDRLVVSSLTFICRALPSDRISAAAPETSPAASLVVATGHHQIRLDARPARIKEIGHRCAIGSRTPTEMPFTSSPAISETRARAVIHAADDHHIVALNHHVGAGEPLRCSAPWELNDAIQLLLITDSSSAQAPSAAGQREVAVADQKAVAVVNVDGLVSGADAIAAVKHTTTIVAWPLVFNRPKDRCACQKIEQAAIGHIGVVGLALPPCPTLRWRSEMSTCSFPTYR